MPTACTKLPISKLRILVADEEAAEPYVLALLATFEDGDVEVNGWVNDALRKVRQPPPDLADRFATLCQSPNAAVASWSCVLLSQLGELSSRYQSAIVNVLEKHPEITARQQAAVALGNVPDLDQQSLNALRQAAANSDPRLQRLATQAIAKVT